MVDDLMSGIKVLKKLLGLGFGEEYLLKICSLESELRIEGEKRGTLLGFGRCGYFRSTVLERFEVLTVFECIALAELVDNKMLAHGIN